MAATAITSAATVENHMPSRLQIRGKAKTAEHWKMKVRKKEISAEVTPSPRAVKKEEPKIAKPENRKDRKSVV